MKRYSLDEIKRIEDPALLAELARTDPDSDVRGAAADRIEELR